MQALTFDKPLDRDQDQDIEPSNANSDGSGPYKYYRYYSLFPAAILFAMVCAFLLLDAVLPLRGLSLYEGLPAEHGQWFLTPTSLLFPGWAITPHISASFVPDPSILPVHFPPAPILLSWQELPLLLIAISTVFLVYLLALRHLPRQISRRYILLSTLLLGGVCLLIPVLTSPDAFSYISYARMGVLYHLNPLTTTPNAIPHDPTYPHIYWVDQPSAYGPTWAAITSFLQWITLLFGVNHLVPMLIALRLLGLFMHLGSTWLIWSIGGYLQRLNGHLSPEKRLLATLAFAWNPLLLFEACANAHNDTTLLFLILLAIWFFLPRTRAEYLGAPALSSLLPATVLLALATCLKINIIVLFPGLLLYIWTRGGGQRVRNTLLVAGVYLTIIALLYAPFWQNGALLQVLRVNPATSRNINSLADFLSHFANSLIAVLGFPLPPPIGSPIEHFTHTLSTVLFIVIYALICWQTLRNPHRISTLPGLIRWMAIVWLLYCVVGTPWFWPWYLTTFFGLYALLEMLSHSDQSQKRSISTRLHSFALFKLRLPLATRLLAFSMFSLYCFYIRGPAASFLPLLPGFKWTYLLGVWCWLLPLLANHFPLTQVIARMSYMLRSKPSNERVH